VKDPASLNWLAADVRRQVADVLPHAFQIEVQWRTIEYTGEWTRLHSLHRVPEGFDCSVGFAVAEATVWGFIVAAVASVTSRSMRVVLHLNTGEEVVVFPLPLAGIREVAVATGKRGALELADCFLGLAPEKDAENE
jgi:hypothetical protein